MGTFEEFLHESGDVLTDDIPVVDGGISKAVKMNEAVNRMRKLGILDYVIKEFENDGTVEFSEPTNIGREPVGVLFWLHNEPEWLAKVQEFEQEHHCLVYHVIHSYTEFGELLNVLYVSDYPEEWEMDNADIEDGYAMAYCINLDVPEFSEFGSIAVQKAYGGLIRGW